MSINSVDYVCIPLLIRNHALAVDEVTALPESLAAISTEVTPDDKTNSSPPSIRVHFLKSIRNKMGLPQAPLPTFL